MKISALLKWLVVLHLTSFGFANGEKASTEPPKLRELRFPDDLSVNEETTLNCYVRRGTEPYRFAWFKNEVPLVPNDRMSVAQVSGRMTTLTFRSVSPEDVGNYTCQVSNPAGKDTVSATLHVTGGPDICERIDCTLSVIS
ncbi:opioid-binding protein/cell adhesion molecule-like [Ixodes scapularis]|uniref:opioid-binding protein/cell adhesion molecule-like n=1 Tax=Ixodes scapularis TaxID=6945 RepID=UPI001A9E10C6|nr:opioid-binding protein/cell adhesion molecule-like [Ixodes scapularis]